MKHSITAALLLSMQSSSPLSRRWSLCSDIIVGDACAFDERAEPIPVAVSRVHDGGVDAERHLRRREAHLRHRRAEVRPPSR